MNIKNLFGEIQNSSNANAAENEGQKTPSKDTTQKVGMAEIFLPIFISVVAVIFMSQAIKKML